VHWALAADEQMALCEAMFTSMGFGDEFQISPATLLKMTISIHSIQVQMHSAELNQLV
jgi:hypothetical protein